MALVDHDFHHLFANEFLLRALGVAGGFDLFAGSLGETNGKDSEHEAVSSLGLDKGFNDIVPLLDELAEFVSGDVHAVEVGVAVHALHFFNLHLHLSPGISTALVLQVSQRHLKHSSFQTVSSNL